MDFSALENRLMGHYTHAFDGGDYAKRLEDECPHDNTVRLIDRFGLTISRNRAKTINYALGYGAGRGKVAQILGCDNWLAGEIHKAWWDDRESMKDLKEALITSLRNRGHVKGRAGLWPGAWIKGLDGRKVYMRSMHAAVNTLIQSAGAVIDKFVTVSIQKGIDKQGLDAHFVGNFHDEVQCEVAEKDIDKYKQVVVDSIEKVNSHFKLEVPMTGDIKTGNNWRDTH
jgi:DNA polymerase I-like protein with 3'-5' exonuclease and polymerase domains